MDRVRRATAVAAAVVLLAAVGVLVTQDRDPSAAEVLARARRFVERAGSVTFMGRMRIEADGASRVSRARVQGVTRFPDRSRTTVDDGVTVTEVLSIGRELYTRTAMTRAELAGERYAALDLGRLDAGIIGRRLRPEQLGELTNLPAILASARDARIDERVGSRTVILALVDAGRAFGELGAVVTRAAAQLTVGRAGRLEAIRLVVRLPAFQVERQYQLSQWGERTALRAPAEDQLDPTPALDEEDVTAFDDAPLFQPRRIPAGWVLEGATVVPAEHTVEGCEQVNLEYIDPDDPTAGYLSIFELPVSCADLELGDGRQPFRAGRYEGTIEDARRTGVLVQVLVGSTVVQADTDLRPEDVATILADLVPLDFDVAPLPIAGVGARQRAA